MAIFITVLIVLAAVCVGFFVLIQNPKGGGLSGNVGGLGNQLMGVKQTTDVLEKGTWFSVAALVVLVITSSLFMKASKGGENSEGIKMLKNINTNQPAKPAGK